MWYLAHDIGVPHAEPMAGSSDVWTVAAILVILTVLALWYNSRVK